MRIYLPIFFILFLLFTAACNQHSAKIDNEIAQIVITTFRLDCTKKPLIDSLRRVAETIGNARLLAYNDFLNKEWQWHCGTQSPEEKKRLEAEIVYIGENSPYIDLRGHVFFWKGTNLFYDQKDYTTALSWFFTGKILLEEANYERFPYIMDYYKGMMDVYSYFGDFKKAIYYCEQALKLPESNIYGRQSIYNDLGTYYLRLRELDKAESAFLAGIEVCKQHNWTSFELLIRGNLSNLLRLRGDYKGALPYFYKSIREDAKESPESAGFSHINAAMCLLHLDSVSKAKQYLKPPNFEMPPWSQPSYNIDKFETWALYYEKTGNFALAAHCKDSLLAIKEVIRVTRDNRKLTALESSLQAEKYMRERKKLETQRDSRNIIIITLIVLFGAWVYWLIQKRKQDLLLARQKQLIAEQKRQYTEEMLVRANQQLTKYLTYIKEKNNLIERLSLQLDGHKEVHTLSEDKEKNYIETMKNTVLLTEADWIEFKNLFEQVFPHYFTQLDRDYPELKLSEIRLLALEKLNLLDKDKGNMLGISADSVKKSRYRLRKKYPELLAEGAG